VCVDVVEWTGRWTLLELVCLYALDFVLGMARMGWRINFLTFNCVLLLVLLDGRMGGKRKGGMDGGMDGWHTCLLGAWTDSGGFSVVLELAGRQWLFFD